jgi:hypothetical protein
MDGKLHIRRGLNGNVYAFACNPAQVQEVCRAIGKSEGAVYFKPELYVWSIRCKDKKHKAALLSYKKEVLLYDD